MSNIGIGHGAIDAGAGYTYLNPQTGHEFSGVLGFTYNFANQSTQYQNGVDMRFDWGASQFLSKQVLIGAVGYVYTELGCDSGSGDRPTGAGDISNVGCPMKRITSSSNCQGTRWPPMPLLGHPRAMPNSVDQIPETGAVPLADQTPNHLSRGETGRDICVGALSGNRNW
jgi:hypothetical protein